MGFFMLDPLLFIGFAQTDEVKKNINSLSPAKKDLLICQGSNYFHPLDINRKAYLGKTLPKSVTIEELKLAESHLKSLVRLVFPKLNPATLELILIPYSDANR